ncbi:MAG: agmatinase family protein [Desulfurococcales archaeon]|nr:agmatinase family protein [Desulfurococcales archaeon]
MDDLLIQPGTPFLRDFNDRRVSSRLGPLEKSNIILAGVPWDWNITGRPGSRFSPQTVRKYLYSLTTFHPTLGDFHCWIHDAGDVRVAPGDWSTSSERIKVVMRKMFAYNDKTVVILGGDHSITGAVLRALLDSGRVGLLFFDAHYDMRRLGEGYSSGTWLRELYEEYGRGRLNTALVGVLEYSNPPYLSELAMKHGVKVVTLDDILRGGIEQALKTVDWLANEGMDYYYISVDMDHLDQAYAPGVNAPSSIGMTPRETLAILEYAIKKLHPKGVDFTEVSPLVDLNDITSRLTASLVMHSMHYICGGGKG